MKNTLTSVFQNEFRKFIKFDMSVLVLDNHLNCTVKPFLQNNNNNMPGNHTKYLVSKLGIQSGVLLRIPKPEPI